MHCDSSLCLIRSIHCGGHTVKSLQDDGIQIVQKVLKYFEKAGTATGVSALITTRSSLRKKLKGECT
nr:MAG TPA: hypothetical protein [Caudoviricetes sp.]